MNWALIGKILVTLLVVGIIGGGSYYYGTMSSAKPSPTPTPFEDQVIDEVTEGNSPSPTESQKEVGVIKGVLGYPSSGIPPLTVYALSAKDGGKNFFVKTAQDQGSFSIEDVDPGTYHIVAYTEDSKLSGGWSKMVPCGLSVDCKDHTLINVEVKAGETAGGIEVRDWYAPEGTFPVKPQ